MIGKVIDGRYSGSGVYKLPEKNVLFIQTDDGEKIALSKQNVLSIDDVSEQYSYDGQKAMMVLWNDFETSIIQYGGAQKKQEKQLNNNLYAQQTHKKKERHFNIKNKRTLVLCCIIFIVISVSAIFVVRIANNNGEQNTAEISMQEEPVRTKDDAILEAQTLAIQKASNELKKKLKNPSSLIINDAKFYYPDYDEENMVMNYAAVKLDYNATNSFGGSVRDKYTYFLVDIETLSAEQVVHIGMN